MLGAGCVGKLQLLPDLAFWAKLLPDLLLPDAVTSGRYYFRKLLPDGFRSELLPDSTTSGCYYFRTNYFRTLLLPDSTTSGSQKSELLPDYFRIAQTTSGFPSLLPDYFRIAN